MGVSKNRGGYPPKWMVKIMENPIKMDDLGVPLFLETPLCCGTPSCLPPVILLNFSGLLNQHIREIQESRLTSVCSLRLFKHIFPKVPLVNKRLIETTS